jgi:hypothetical protein
VNERQTAPSREPEGGFTSNDLIQRIMVARYVRRAISDFRGSTHAIEYIRLLALSLQENEINVDIWERAKGLEAARRARIQ